MGLRNTLKQTFCKHNFEISLNSVNSDMLKICKHCNQVIKLNAVYRKEWKPILLGGQIIQENYIDYGIFYSDKFVSESEKDEIIAEEKNRAEKKIKSWGRNPKYDNYFVFTKVISR